MKKSDFYFELPVELIAQSPLAERSASRLLHVPTASAGFEDRMVRDLPELLNAGDLLIFNDTKVLPARIYGAKDTGGHVEILVHRVMGGQQVRAQIGASKSPKPGSRIRIDPQLEVLVIAREDEYYILQFETDEPLESVLNRVGKIPLPPYIKREVNTADQLRYQTVFAKQVGAVAAPTAGLHFDQALLNALQAKGVQFGHITLHVGAGTFAPMRSELISEHKMHREWLNVGAELCQQIRQTRESGRRVIAAGTTVVRALETAVRDGQVLPYAGDTQIFIFPGYKIRSIDALFTNFHLPESTLLMLVSAFGGHARLLAAYQYAIAQGYRFFSYGDAMLLWPGQQT